MIKVIEHGYNRYTCRCHQCNCLFEYELSDIIEKGCVKCPDCSDLCHHSFSLNVDHTSRINEEVE